MQLQVDDHPLLDLRAFITEFSAPLGELATPPEILELLGTGAAPSVSDEIKTAVRALLRHGGFAPSGRGKPASEYLQRAASKGLNSINLAVDACNASSLHSGIPISVIDLGLSEPPFRVAVVPKDAVEDKDYVFNATGQVIDLRGLLCLHDERGPCANAVKDSQRTKTSEATTRTLSLVWGPKALEGLSESTAYRYTELLGRAGARTESIEL